MVSLPGYKIIAQIDSNTKTSIYHGLRRKDNVPVILKVLNAEYPQIEDISQLKHEFNLINKINIPGVIKAYSLEKVGYSYVLVLEDIPDSGTLSHIIPKLNEIAGKNIALKIDLFLQLALPLARTLYELHSQNIIHKDIKPANIIVTSNLNQIKIIDFGISTQLSHENQQVVSPEGLEGTLAYMSPEQTTRMNHSVDHRTDLYSLGVTFYELLTGQLPFHAQDAMEWVHSHIAKQPRAPKEVNPDIPDVLSNIVLKLLAKKPEDRYSTANGLVADLERFATAWNQNHEIINFPLGEKDHTGDLQIPQKLYGREAEVDDLMATFTRISHGARELLLVYGYPGIGKTALINEIHKPVIKQHGYYTSGKFEQFQQKIPYFGLIQAFKKLIQQILTENQTQIELWRDKILKSLASNGQILVDVIPEVEWLIGKQPSVPALPPSEARNRFELVFFDFVQAFARPEHPTVIFLDDMQWADLASLDLIKKLLKDDSLKYLLLIGVYRDNETLPGHPLLDMIDDLSKMHVPMGKIQIKPLTLESIKELVHDTLNTQTDITPLAELILDKTGGNPFFVNTFLTMLYEDQYLVFDTKKSEWIWDINALKALTITDNVVDLVISKIEKLPKNAQELLQMAACIGNQFDLKTLASIYGASLEETANDLWPNLEANLIIPLSDGYKLIIADPDYASGKKEILYRFSHDRIQQSAAAMLSADQLSKINLKLGRLMLANSQPEELNERLFEITNHFNESLSLITSDNERLEIAKLNFRAGEKAKTSIAYESAALYYERTIQLLGENAWENHYQMMLDCHLGYAESIHLLGRFDEADKQFNILISRAKTRLDKARIIMLQTLSYAVQSKLEEAVDSGLRGLAALGMPARRHPSGLHVFIEIIKTYLAVRKLSFNDMLRIPALTDPEKILYVDFIERVCTSAYLCDPNLLALLGLKNLRYCLKHGYTAASSTNYLVYSMILVAGFHRYETGHEFSKLALQVADKFDDFRIRSMIYFTSDVLVFPWKEPYRDCFVRINKAYHFSRQAGDLLYSSYAAAVIPQMMLVQGDELSEIEKRLKVVSVIPEFTKHLDSLGSIKTFERLLPVLKAEKPKDFFDIRVSEFFENKIPFTHPVTYGSAGILCLIGTYLLEDWEAALGIIERIKPHIKAPYMVPLFMSAEYYFFSALVYLNCFQKASFWKRLKYKRHIKMSLSKFKTWSTHCPSNFEAKYKLLLGSWQYITGDSTNALTSFDQSIVAAREYGLTMIEAIANEFVGRLYHYHGQPRHAKLYLQEAVLVYQRWGGNVKLKLISEQYPEVTVKLDQLRRSDKSSYSSTNTSLSKDAALDFSSIIKSVQSISSKVVLDDLLLSLIKIAMENAGATRSLLLLKQNEQFMIAAKCDSADANPEIIKHLPVEEYADVSQSIIKHVQRKKEAVVLNDAAREGIFTEDPYIANKKPTSILCFPVMHQGEILCILYLENNLTAGAFSAARLDVLQLISGQAAISLLNSQIYTALDRFVPHEFLDMLGKQSIIDVRIGDNIQKEMTVLFCDIRGFTSLSEKISPEENFKFINEYLSYMGPCITEHGGFIDKFIGDGIMALFPINADPVQAAIDMIGILDKYNENSAYLKQNDLSIQIGIGLNSGLLMLGTVGGERRMDATVISDAVNTASRVQDLTKIYGVPCIITEETYKRLASPAYYHLRKIDHVLVKGKTKLLTIYEVYDVDDKPIIALKEKTLGDFSAAMDFYHQKKYEEALALFQKVLEVNPQDTVAALYVKRCNQVT